MKEHQGRTTQQEQFFFSIRIDCVANSPQPLISGMNSFLKMIETTFRRDPTNYRPRINKAGSVKDKEQKLSGHYFVVEAD